MAESDDHGLSTARAVVAKHETECREHGLRHGAEELLAVEVVQLAVLVVEVNHVIAVSTTTAEHKVLVRSWPQHQAEHHAQQVENKQEEQENPDHGGHPNDKANQHVRKVAKHRRMHQFCEAHHADDPQSADHDDRPSEGADALSALGVSNGHAHNRDTQFQQRQHRDDAIYQVPEARRPTDIFSKAMDVDLQCSLRDEHDCASRLQDKPTSMVRMVVDRGAKCCDVSKHDGGNHCVHHALRLQFPTLWLADMCRFEFCSRLRTPCCLLN
mmetsp:Transcript_66534/g.192094  ORF Transcript_66534/g.192094 Transcript_66534/m.192094 type:complete len:270 (+) Transcript_66534:456-1265(+)